MAPHELIPTLQQDCTLCMSLFLPTFECIGRRVDSRPGLVAPHVGDGAENLLAGGIDDIDAGFRARIPPIAADQRLLAQQILVLQCSYLFVPRASSPTSPSRGLRLARQVVSSERYRTASRIFH